MGKTYLIEEVITLLRKKPSLKFSSKQSTGDELLTMGPDGRLDWYSPKLSAFTETYFRIYDALNWEWQLMQEPVTWQEAIEAWANKSSDIEVHRDGEIKTIKIITVLGYIGQFGAFEHLDPKDFRDGTWYIKGDN